jgi:hypothetical protein
MLSCRELNEKLSDVAIGRMSIRDFEEWFVPASWNANAWATPALRDAVYSLELAIAEYSNGHVHSSYLRAFSGDIARELEQSSQSIVSAQIGRHLTSSEIMLGGVPAKPLLAAA